MDPNNFVAPGNGGWVVYRNGKYVGTYPTQQEAEQNFNSSGGQPGTLQPAGKSVAQMRIELQAAGYPGPWDDASVSAVYARTANGGNANSGLSGITGAGIENWPGLWQALTGSNQQRFDWEKDMFNRNLDWSKESTNKSLYSGMAQSLLGTSTQLAGVPKSWMDYAKYPLGGKNIFNSIWGNQPVPSFGVSGTSPQRSVSDILRDLGLA